MRVKWPFFFFNKKYFNECPTNCAAVTESRIQLIKSTFFSPTVKYKFSFSQIKIFFLRNIYQSKSIFYTRATRQGVRCNCKPTFTRTCVIRVFWPDFNCGKKKEKKCSLTIVEAASLTTKWRRRRWHPCSFFRTAVWNVQHNRV